MSIKGFEVGGVQQQYDYTALDNIPANLVQDANYVHTDNNYTNADKTKLSGIEAQANKTTIDATLTHSGQAADAKATGDAISALNAQVIASMPHDTASGSIASFPDGAAMPVIDCSVAIEPVQSGSGDPAPDNVRPITGWTDCKVTRTGKNLFDKTKTGSLGAITWAYESGFLMKANRAYTLSVGSVGSGGLFDSIGIYKTDKTTQLAISYQQSLTYTPTSDTLVVFRFYKNPSVTQEAIDTVQLELGSTATSYSAFVGNSYTIDLDGTRYGGTLDVTTGKLTVDRAMVDLGTLNWLRSSSGDGKFYSVQTTTPNYKLSSDATMVCSQYIFDGVGSAVRGYFGGNGTLRYYYEMSTQRELYVHDQSKDSMTANQFKTAMSGVQLVYELEEPIEVDLTPTQITTLLGTNNIWADAGDTTVSYYADTTLFVNKKIAAAVAALS